MEYFQDRQTLMKPYIKHGWLTVDMVNAVSFVESDTSSSFRL